jgi:putative membrane protein
MRFSALRSRSFADRAGAYNGVVTDPPEKDPRVYFALERTYLAWIRTGLALIGVGFAVSRFGLFLREFFTQPTNSEASQTTHSVIAGVILVILGVIINVAATVRHFQTTRQLSSGTWEAGHVSRTAVTLAVILTLVGGAMAIYLLLLR